MTPRRHCAQSITAQRGSASPGRRRFLSGALGSAIALMGGGRIGRAQIPAEASLFVAYEDAGTPIAADFIGLSYESAILTSGAYFAPDNASVLGLIRALGASGVIRIGGNTSAQTLWQPTARPDAPGSFAITPAAIDRLADAMRAIGWKLIYGLNLARDAPEEAAAEATYVAQALGPNLLAFQIGNEPDGFGRWADLRPRSYDAAGFLAEWRAFHAAIRARLPDARFAGPDVAGQTDWVAAFAATRPTGLVLLTHHYYAEGPAGAADVTLAKLLQTDAQLRPRLDAFARTGRAYQLPYRIVEANSVYNEGQAGVRGTLGAALWGLDFMFEAASAGAAGVNFHAGIHNLRPGEDKAYTPIARDGDRYRARPLYYGMLMFSLMARGSLVPSRLLPDAGDLKAYAVRATDGGLRVCLINKSFTRAAHLRIDPGRRFAAASVMRLQGPAMDATAGITLGGSGVDAFGGWTPVREPPTCLADREISLDVPAASAALMTLYP